MGIDVQGLILRVFIIPFQNLKTKQWSPFFKTPSLYMLNNMRLSLINKMREREREMLIMQRQRRVEVLLCCVGSSVRAVIIIQD